MPRKSFERAFRYDAIEERQLEHFFLKFFGHLYSTGLPWFIVQAPIVQRMDNFLSAG